MTARTIDSHIEITPGVMGDKPRIAGRRITVQNIAVWHDFMGRSADEIVTEYDLSLAEVYAALAYYHEHRAEIEKSMREGDGLVKTLRATMPSKVSKKLNEAET